MKITLEIGDNLRSSIQEIIEECNRVNSRCEYPQLDPGWEVSVAFGIDFVKLIEQDPKLQNLKIIVDKT